MFSYFGDYSGLNFLSFGKEAGMTFFIIELFLMASKPKYNVILLRRIFGFEQVPTSRIYSTPNAFSLYFEADFSCYLAVSLELFGGQAQFILAGFERLGFYLQITFIERIFGHKIEAQL